LVGKLSKPFRDRFKLAFYFETYSEEDLVLIVKKHAEMKGIAITDEASRCIASRSRGIPRIAVSFLDRVKDAAIITDMDEINTDLSEAVFRIMGIDKNGLTKNDIKMLKTLYDNGNPVGVDTLSIMINEQVSSVENNIEPFLIQSGLMLRTGKGRTITQKGLEYMIEMGYVPQQKSRRF
jgi:Holliday junction DNA helicase RuvB